jgi:DNA polymerase iota
LRFRLLLASHLAQHIRRNLEHELGYTATVGISTNKLLSKLVGNVNKPNSQTTLIPPYTADDDDWDNVTPFIDDHEVGKIPGIGFKIAQKIRQHVLQRPADFDDGLVYGGTKDPVKVRDVRTYPDMGSDVLERILGGPGAPHGIGTRVWDLLNGSDDTPVSQARIVPRQISIEDSYIRLDTMSEVVKQLRVLAISLLKRMRTDLVEIEQEPVDDSPTNSGPPTPRWLAHPKTLRLSTRPRPPQNPDGSRNRSFARISKSAPMPSFVFSLKEAVETLAERLIREALMPLFKHLHPEKQGWNLSLVNLAATNMVEGASEKGGAGRDIGKMFRRQDDVLAPFRVRDDPVEGAAESLLKQRAVSELTEELTDEPREGSPIKTEREPYQPKFVMSRFGSEDTLTPSQEINADIDDSWEEDDDMLDADTYRCDDCGAVMPLFAMGAHDRWHAQG